RFARALEQLHSQLVFQIANLAAHGRLRDVKFLCRGAQDVFSLRHRDEVTKMPQFHGRYNYAGPAYRDKKHRLSHLHSGKWIVVHDENGTSTQWRKTDRGKRASSGHDNSRSQADWFRAP